MPRRACGEAAQRTDVAAHAAAGRRLFQDALTFAAVLERRGDLEHDVLNRLFSLASRFAPDPAAHLRYRFEFAKLFVAHDKPERAVELYQQILKDRTLRELSTEVDGPAPGRAARKAAAKIAELLRAHGPKIYEAYETEAQQWLSGAQAAGDAELLQRIVQTYPNSRAAPAALIAFGELLAEGGNAEDAVEPWVAAYQRYGGRVDRAAIFKRIADAVEAAGDPERAYLWLTKAAREHPTTRFEHAGRQWTFLEYRARLERMRERVGPARPQITPPLELGFARSFDEQPALLRARFHEHPDHRFSPAFAYTEKAVYALDPRSGRDLWPEPADVRMSVELLIATAETAVMATPYEIVGLDASTGRRRFSVGEYPRHLDDFAADWETGEAFRTHALHGRKLVSVRDNGDSSCIDIATGKLLWRQTFRPAPWGDVAICDHEMVYHVVQDGQALLCRVDMDSGAWHDAVATGESNAVEQLACSLDRQLILITSHSISSFDLKAGLLRWRTALQGHVRSASVMLDLDALYLSDDGFDLTKINLHDGKVLWKTDGLLKTREDDLTLDRASDSIIVTSANGAAAVDPITGLLLWRGTAPPNPRFVSRFVLRDYVLAVSLPGEVQQGDNTAFFYDHRHASGVIPTGGAVKLGTLDDVRRIVPADGALLIQAGNVIHAWMHE